MLSEFDIIRRFFVQDYPPDPRFALGIGDDCALINPTPGKQLAISSDMLVAGRHFFADADPLMLGHKCLAVNLSDLAAMGATPLAFTLSIALPSADAAWLASFSQGLLRLANEHQCRLIGGDTTKGPLNISITIFGELRPGAALKRGAAQVDDDIWISGTLGDARLALAGYLKELDLSPQEHQAAALCLHQPTPRITLGLALTDIAHAALDVSDGLIGDLGHILERSQFGASLEVDLLPVGAMLKRQAIAIQREFMLTGGDDYELCFTAPAKNRDAVIAAGIASHTAVTRVGRIEAEKGLRLIDTDGKLVTMTQKSFDHFTSS